MIHMTCETSTSRWQRLLQKRADLQRAARTGLRGRWMATDVACLGCCSVVFPMDPVVPSERKGMFGDVWGYNLLSFGGFFDLFCTFSDSGHGAVV